MNDKEFKERLLYYWNQYEVYKHLAKFDLINFQYWLNKMSFAKWYLEKVLNVEVNC